MFSHPIIKGIKMLYDKSSNGFYLYHDKKFYYNNKNKIESRNIPYYNKQLHCIILNKYNYVPSDFLINENLYIYKQKCLYKEGPGFYTNLTDGNTLAVSKNIDKYNATNIIYLIFNQNIRIFNKKNIKYTMAGPIIKKKDSFYWFSFDGGNGLKSATINDWAEAIKPKYLYHEYENKEYICKVNYPIMNNKRNFLKSRQNIKNYQLSCAFEYTPCIYFAPIKYILIYDLFMQYINKYIIKKIFDFL